MKILGGKLANEKRIKEHLGKFEKIEKMDWKFEQLKRNKKKNNVIITKR